MVIRGWRVWAIVLVAVALVSGCKSSAPEEGPRTRVEPTGPHASLLRLFPGIGDVTDWKAAGDAKVFGPVANTVEGVDALTADAPSTAILCQGYGYSKSATRRYVRGQGGESVTVRIFEMKGPQDAFGLFTVASSGTQYPNVGLAARMSTQALSFVKGSYFATVEYAGSSQATAVLMEFGRSIADQISSPGYRPAVLDNFPLGAQEGECYYLHTFESLAALPFVPRGDAALMKRMLGLTPETDVAIMGYPTAAPGVMNYLFVIHYASDEDAKAAFAGYDGYLSNTTSAAEKNVAVAPPVRAYLAGTFNAEENSVKDVLAKLLAGLGG